MSPTTTRLRVVPSNRVSANDGLSWRRAAYEQQRQRYGLVASAANDRLLQLARTLYVKALVAELNERVHSYSKSWTASELKELAR